MNQHSDQTSSQTRPTGSGSRLAQFACSSAGICLALSILTFVCFWPVTHHDFINLDDQDYITENLHVQNGLTWESVAWAFRTAHACNWHPVTWISHMVDCELYGLNAGGHHLTNVFFHIANTLLLFLLLNRLTGARWRSAFVAALFAWHPLHVESVAWASERKDVLSTFFFLLTLGAYLSYVNSKSRTPDSPEATAPNSSRPDSHLIPRWVVHYCLALLFFALALMSKPMVVTLPFVLLLLDYWPLQRLRLSFSEPPFRACGRLIVEKLPFFALALGGSVVTFLVQRSGGAVSPLEAIPLYLRGINAVMAYLRYISKAFLPLGLAPFYRYEMHWQLGLVLAACLVLAVWSFLFLWKSKRYPYLGFGWCWFLGTLVPTIGLVQVGSQSMADRYMYIPSIGLFLLVVWALNDLRCRLPNSNRIFTASGIAALTCYLLCTCVQVGYWKNGLTLFQHTLDVTTGNSFAYAYVAKAYDDAGQKDKALAYSSEAVRLNPHFVQGQYNLGTLLLNLGRTDEAVKCLNQAITDDPKFARAYNNLGRALLSQGHPEEAISRYTEAIKLNSDWPEAYYNLGTALLTISKPAEAIAEFSEASHLNPRYADAHMNWAIACAELGKTDEALVHFGEAVRLAPENPDARFNFGIALLERNKASEAATQFASGLRLRPGDPRMQSRLEQALARK